MGIRLKVPLVLQHMPMECWYAAACMVAYYRKPGPRLGLPDKWPGGIEATDFARLAKVEGLKPIRSAVGVFTAQSLEMVLRSEGPIWCAGVWDGFKHIVVLTGVDQHSVYINDPNPSKGARVETIAWFNQRLVRIPDCMLYMPA